MKNTIAFLCIAAAFPFTATNAHAQPATPTFPTSFDCSKAKSDSEHLICENSDLAAKDVRLAGLIKKARTVAADQAAFKEWARNALKDRQKCHDAKCVSDWYDNQLAEYEDELSSNKPASKLSESDDTQTRPDGAQAMPPACAQIIRAMEVCTADVSNWLDTHDPEQAAKARKSGTAAVEKLKADMQRGVKSNGEMVTAQRCASQDVRHNIVGNLGGSLTPILFARGDVHNCTNALATLQ
ncbi:lysozyme inhibitor LprI family protein [Paraburkholderia sp. BR10936]|uniref:lysozyme inhibitor LprI family protein n=1 Tax=Paraburkholderia sp. BR10936 TaxID=3236993 RepID=UPI0034D16576